ncbi:MAG: hypothetical protein U5K74_14140 [Gemmatimonadaceae bacterium]|nr:hypothetical protein [Gemmatimonadaceae bacterium]
MDLGADGAALRAGTGEGVRAVIAWLTRKFSRDPGQLGLFEVAAPITDLRRSGDERPSPPRDAPSRAAPVIAPPLRAGDPAAFLQQLRAVGLRGVERVVFTQNRRTMVSLSSGVLRIHEGFVAAPPHVHAAIATFSTSRNRTRRAAARDIIVAYPVPIRAATRRPAVQHADDAPMAARLTLLHAQLNLEHFGGMLDPLEIQVSPSGAALGALHTANAHRRRGRDRHFPAPCAARRLAGGDPHAAARDGAPVAGRNRPACRSRRRLPRQVPRRRHCTGGDALHHAVTRTFGVRVSCTLRRHGATVPQGHGV